VITLWVEDSSSDWGGVFAASFYIKFFIPRSRYKNVGEVFGTITKQETSCLINLYGFSQDYSQKVEPGILKIGYLPSKYCSDASGIKRLL